jgi:hypothetical protein
MMATWPHDTRGDPLLTVEQQLALVRREQEALERRVALIEALIDAIRSEDRAEEERQ